MIVFERALGFGAALDVTVVIALHAGIRRGGFRCALFRSTGFGLRALCMRAALGRLARSAAVLDAAVTGARQCRRSHTQGRSQGQRGCQMLEVHGLGDNTRGRDSAHVDLAGDGGGNQGSAALLQ